MTAQRFPDLPLPPPLRGADRGSFAQDTVVRRMPAIGRRVLDENTLTPQAAHALAALIAELPEAAVRPIDDAGAPDLDLWAAYVEPYLGVSWIDVPWFFAETYFYRRILEATGYFQPGPGRLVDPYALQKRLGLKQATVDEGPEDLQAALSAAILGALWGNQADLSLWPAGATDGPGGAHLLVDDTALALAYIEALAERAARCDMILDNAGAELVGDLVLADVLLRRGLRVVLHAKMHPTFVSDAIVDDVHTTIGWLAALPGASMGRGLRLAAALESGRLELRSDWYWTSPLAGWEMPDALYADLALSGLLISKGDANYRRWLGDLHWPYASRLNAVLSYAPAPLLLLRTCKSEVAAGLDPQRMAEAATRDLDWLTGGRWGVIQLGAVSR